MAVALFSRKGFEDTSVEEICLAAGYSKGGFYFHFRSKDDLLAQILDGDVGFVDGSMGPFVVELWAAASRNTSLRKRLNRREKVTFLSDHSQSRRVVASASPVDLLLTLKKGLQIQERFLPDPSREAKDFVDALLVALNRPAKMPARRAS